MFNLTYNQLQVEEQPLEIIKLKPCILNPIYYVVFLILKVTLLIIVSILILLVFLLMMLPKGLRNITILLRQGSLKKRSSFLLNKKFKELRI